MGPRHPGQHAERLGLEVEILCSDDGIVLQPPEAVDVLPVDELACDPDEVEAQGPPTPRHRVPVPRAPLLLEATRQCRRDVLAGVAARTIRGARPHPRSSPFAPSVLSGWIATCMDEADASLEERRAVALALDRNLLRELLGSDELRGLVDPEALAALELEL